VYSSASNKQTSHSLIKKCNFSDTHELATINKFNKHKKIIFFDCGSNFGFYSLFVASLSKKNRIFAFEASKNTKLQLDKNILINNFNNIISYNKAIADIENQELIFNVSDNDWESSLTHSDFLSFKSERILSTTIDHEIKLKDFTTDYFLIIKIDIEGHELKAFEGFGKYLDGDFVDYIQFEYGGANLDSHTSLMELCKFLEERGFRVAKVMPSGLEIRKYSPFMDNFNYANYVAISNKVVR
jgi:FkbM family methyltransferase